MISSSNNSFDEQRWVARIRRTFDDEELHNEAKFSVCIFSVPKPLVYGKPDCYMPQHVALGPYHRWREELHQMDGHKVAAARRAQSQFQKVKFEFLVEELQKLMPKIRACYHRYLDLSRETLAWMFAVDACFLLEFLRNYEIKEGKKSTHYVILRDIVMLENQIPLFLLRKVLEFQHSSIEAADEILSAMLVGLCNELSPLKMMNFHVPEFAHHLLDAHHLLHAHHLLDVLYHMMVPKSDEEEQSDIIEVLVGPNVPTVEEDTKDSNPAKKFIGWIFYPVSKLASVTKPVDLLSKLPWAGIINRLPVFSILKAPATLLYSNTGGGTKAEDENSSSTNNINKPPLLEEIAIPSVTDLHKSGVRFKRYEGDITSIRFDRKTLTFYLPTVTLDVYTEVVLRNLVAYEASNASGPLTFTRYTELMNGIIDTKEDVKLLREKGIILSHLKSDEEVANLWNGMSRSLRLTKVQNLDKAIEDVNKYYNGTWKVKAGNYMKKYVYGSWQFLALLAAILLLLLTTVQSFCSVYSCADVLKIGTTTNH